ncbi:MAG: hypothetical protein ACE366_21300 [Bradymonadia bacterium]
MMNRSYALMLYLAFAIAAQGCDDSGGGGGGDSDGGVGGAEQACAVSLSTEAARAGTVITLEGVDLGEREFAIVVNAPALPGPTAIPGTYLPDDQQIGFFAPAMVETMDAETTFAVELHVDGADPCRAGTLTVAPLPQVGDASLATVVGDLQSVFDQQLAFFGVTEEMLDDPDPEMVNLLAPLAAVRYALDHPDNPDSLARVADGTAATLSIAGPQRELIDRVLTQVVADLPPLDQMQEGLRPGDLVGASLADCGVLPSNISTADELDCWMSVQSTVQAIFASRAAKYIRATIGVAIGVAGVFTAGTAAAVAGLVNFVVNQMIDALENLLPSSIEDITFVATKTKLCDGESGEVQQVTVVAQNKGWTISIFTIIDGVLASVGVAQAYKVLGTGASAGEALADSARFANLTAGQREAVQQGADTVWGIIRDGIVNFTGLVSPGTGDLVTFGARRFGPITLPDTTWFKVESDDARMPVVVDRYSHESDVSLTATLTVTTLPDRFAGAEASREAAIQLDVVEIFVDPVYAKKGETVILTAEVTCLDDYEILWTTLGTDGGAVLDREAGAYLTPTCDREICTYPGEISAGLVRPGGLGIERGSAEVKVADCCVPNAPPSCTREERCDCDDPPPICEAEFYVAPSGECVAPGSSTTFQVVTDLGGALPEVVWTVRAIEGEAAGEINPEGVWIAPADAERVVIRATDVDDETRWAEATMTVNVECSAWSVTGAPGGLFQGQGVLVPQPRAVPDEDGVLTWTFALNQVGNPQGQPAGALALRGHPGFDDQCQGPTGVYEAAFAVGRMRDGLNAESVSARVLEIGPGGIRIEFSGMGLYAEQIGDEIRESPSFISGSLSTAEGICTGLENPDPIGDAEPLGYIFDPGAPGICLEVFETPDFSERAWNQVCGAAGPQCTDDARCPSARRLGRCDLRALGTQLGFPQIQHYYPDPEIDIADARQSCEFQNGTWYDN